MLVTGLIGALTTFSTFSLESVILFQRGAVPQALLNILMNVTVGIDAVLAGGLLSRQIAKVL